MLKWLFGNNHDILKELIKVLNRGININVHISGDLNVEERRNSLVKETEGFNYISKPIQEGDRPEIMERAENLEQPLPDFSSLKIPQVKFGEDKEN